jgi:hypothetical protein
VPATISFLPPARHISKLSCLGEPQPHSCLTLSPTTTRTTARTTESRARVLSITTHASSAVFLNLGAIPPYSGHTWPSTATDARVATADNPTPDRANSDFSFDIRQRDSQVDRTALCLRLVLCSSIWHPGRNCPG